MRNGSAFQRICERGGDGAHRDAHESVELRLCIARSVLLLTLVLVIRLKVDSPHAARLAVRRVLLGAVERSDGAGDGHGVGEAHAYDAHHEDPEDDGEDEEVAPAEAKERRWRRRGGEEEEEEEVRRRRRVREEERRGVRVRAGAGS